MVPMCSNHRSWKMTVFVTGQVQYVPDNLTLSKVLMILIKASWYGIKFKFWLGISPAVSINQVSEYID